MIEEFICPCCGRKSEVVTLREPHTRVVKTEGMTHYIPVRGKYKLRPKPLGRSPSRKTPRKRIGAIRGKKIGRRKRTG